MSVFLFVFAYYINCLIIQYILLIMHIICAICAVSGRAK